VPSVGPRGSRPVVSGAGGAERGSACVGPRARTRACVGPVSVARCQWAGRQWGWRQWAGRQWGWCSGPGVPGCRRWLGILVRGRLSHLRV